MRKKLGSVLLALALLVTLAPALGGTARASADTLYIAGKEGSGETESSQGGYWEKEWLYNDGYTALTDGKSVWQDGGQGFDNGAKAEFQVAGTSTLDLDGYKTWGSAGYENGGNLYGIYYDGDLIIDVTGENELKAYRTGTYSGVYGIYVTGNLTIKGDGALSVNMNRNANLTAENTSAGIWCGGRLTVQDSVTLEATGGTATGDLGRSVGICAWGGYEQSGNVTVTATGGESSKASYGLYAPDNYDEWSNRVPGSGAVAVRGGALTAAGGTVNCNNDVFYGESAGILTGKVDRRSNTGNEHKTGAVLYGSFDLTGGAVTATGGRVGSSNSVTQASYSYGLASADVTIGGGALTATGGDIDGSVRDGSTGGMSFGVRAESYTQSGADTTVSAAAGKVFNVSYSCPYGGSFGLRTNGFTVGGGTLNAEAKAAYLQSVGVWAEGNASLTGGTVTAAGSASNIQHEQLQISSMAEDSCADGVHIGGTLTATGGSLSGTGGRVANCTHDTRGVYIGGAANVGGTAEVTGVGGLAKATWGGDAEGVFFSGPVLPGSTCGVYAADSLTLSGGALTGTGGDFDTWSTLSLKDGDVYSTGVRVAGAFTGTGGALTGTGGATAAYNESVGTKEYSIGLRFDGAAEFSGVTAAGSGGAGSDRFEHSYGLKSSGGTLTLTAGTLTARGYTDAIASPVPALVAPIYEVSGKYDGSTAYIPGTDTYTSAYKYVRLDAARAIVNIGGWTYSQSANTPAVAHLDRYGDGSVTAAYAYTARGEDAYSETVPVNAGDYTVRATLSNGVTGTADFTIKRAPATVVGGNQTKWEGEADPELMAYITSLENSDAEDVIAYTITREPGEEPGEYAILVSGEAVQGNYNVTYEKGKFTIWTTAVTVSGSVSGGELTYRVQNAPADARLIAARYDGGRMTAMKIVKIDTGSADGTLTMGGSGDTFRLMLVDGTTYAPLCEAWSN